ncbi:hypothetical protein BpHYR1_013824 [Brachionus plicatilis]|uniref:Uncharacterized protein n=1 Tax=Brachionus plicatilis TaxID=10195 RepID=A0A3M7SX73_BRAPC|nr:hypothetical protein BpHYR1_013824 [Brachionus plicatilis]
MIDLIDCSEYHNTEKKQVFIKETSFENRLIILKPDNKSKGYTLFIYFYDRKQKNLANFLGRSSIQEWIFRKK